MDEIQNPPKMTIQEGVACRLTKLLGVNRMVKLIELLDEVIDQTGYGDVKIVIAQGQVQSLKAEKSYR